MNKKYIEINISSSSVQRLRCKYCGSVSRLYYDFPNNRLSKFPKKNKESAPMKYHSGYSDKKIYLDITHKLISLSHNVSRAKNINKNKIIENLCCTECMMSKFPVVEKSASRNVATINRRGKYNYPYKVTV